MSQPPYNTRSQSSRGSSEAGDSTSAAEIEFMQKKLIEKEKQLQEQAQALLSKQSELQNRETMLNKEKEAAVSIDSLSAVLHKLQQNITSLSYLPQQVEKLNLRMDELALSGEIRKELSAAQQQHDRTHIDTDADFNYDANRSKNEMPPTYGFPPDFTTPTSPIRFKDVIDSIPRYDGHKLPVFQFSKICERALKLISPQQEPYLIQLIINKLQGHAYTAVEGMNFHTVSCLTGHLKKIFGPNKSLNQYRGELGNLYMLPNEDIFGYIERVKELRTAIIDGEVDISGNLLPQDEDRIDHECLDAFINGLSSDLLVRLRLEGRYSNLNDAIALAIQLSKTLEAESRRKKPVYPTRSSPPSPRVDLPRATNNPSSSQQPSTANPRTPNVPYYKGGPFIKPLVPGQPGPNYPEVKICRYCKTPGHLINECRKLAYRQAYLRDATGPSIGSDNLSGNAPSVPGTSGVHPNASQSGRQTPPRVVRFQEPTEKSPASP